MPMHTTPLSLLVRLQRPNDSEAWERFIQLYSPLLFEWAGRLRVPEHDAPDLVQNVLIKLLRSIGTFQRLHPGGFRGWLYAAVKHCALDMNRKRQRQPQSGHSDHLVVFCGDDPLLQWTEAEHRAYLLRRITALVRCDFPGVTWQAFERYVLEGRPAGDVAASLGLTVNAVYLARGRVLRRIREELAGMLE